eukprot:15464361-Alexandrium_andersonii.AAC.1
MSSWPGVCGLTLRACWWSDRCKRGPSGGSVPRVALGQQSQIWVGGARGPREHSGRASWAAWGLTAACVDPLVGDMWPRSPTHFVRRQGDGVA